jgi:hypothetical protein
VKPVNLPKWFDLNDADAYARWREEKCAAYPATQNRLVVDIKDSREVTLEESARMREVLGTFNMVIYRTPDISENKNIPLRMGKLFGLSTLDSNIGAGADAVTEIRVKDSGVHSRYIPYTPHKLSWHTDGYYNSPNKVIRAMTLHCVRPAQSGGENELFDHEMAYIYLRDLDPDFIGVLSQPDVMTIPANEEDGKIIRTEQAGSVFSFDENGYLHMRYTARKRNIQWKDSPRISGAVEALEQMFSGDNDWIMRGTLSAGEGLICNNVLHNRREFEDDAQSSRLLYRLRYYERALCARLI